MTLSDLRTRFLGDASWTEPEAWPRRAQIILIAALIFICTVVAGLLLLLPEWTDLKTTRATQSDLNAQLISQSNLISSDSVRSQELQRLRSGKVDPMSVEAVDAAFESSTPDVDVSEGDGGVSIEGEGTFARLESWIAGVSQNPSLPLLRWKSLRIESRDGELNWTGQLERIEKPIESALPSADSHAAIIGRNPFTSLVADVAQVPLPLMAAEPSLPSEDSWPRPAVTDWPIANLRMVGTLGPAQPRALVMAGAKSLYVIRIGDVIGRERRLVTQVSGNRLLAGGTTVSLAPHIIERAP